MEMTKATIEKAVRDMMGSMTTIREIKGISDAEMESLYSLGYNFYRTGNLENAERVFQFLVLFDHFNPRYWIAMGALCQMKKCYMEAITAYAYASFLDIKDPKPQFHAAECYLAAGDKANALSAIAALEEFSPKDTPRGREYRMRAEALKLLASA